MKNPPIPRLKRLTGLIAAMLLAIALVAQPLTVFADYADTYGEPAIETQIETETEAEAEAPPTIFDMFPDLRLITLTEEARDIALYDFNYLADMMMQTMPTLHMFYRVFGISLEDYLDMLRGVIYDMMPIPSFTALLMCPERWTDEPTDALSIAADYMLSLLTIMTIEIVSFAHLSPQPLELVQQTFFASAYVLQSEELLTEEALQELAAMGLDPERTIAATRQFHQAHYNIYSTPSVLWFYGIDPTQFDFDVDISEMLGFMTEGNVTTNIIEPGRIAYIHIASFMNNMAFDSEVLFPFYEEIQDFEHLIIDIRGNGGGFAGYFPSLVVNMLSSESISFMYPEFFVANELTAELFDNPMSLAMANLYGLFPAAEFVQSQNMPYFNQDDLAHLDYVAVWNAVYSPWEYAIPFGGKIWLLVDGGSASASVMAAQLSVNTGFATVVGEPTFRVTGVIYTFAALPNTGVLFRIDLGYTTDMYGRAIEEFGVIPQIPNAAGMDALETVLAIINDAVFTGPEPSAPDEIPRRYVDGVAFVRLRYAAYAFGAAVAWDGPNQAVILTLADGSTVVVYVSTNGVFNDDGRVYVPVEFMLELFEG